jgi:four helix bundle protein
MQDFRELKVWKRAHELTLDVYRKTASVPKQEVYGLTAQLRRAAASTSANIVEGRSRASDAEFARFLVIAAGSAAEAEYHMLLAHDLGYLAADAYMALAEQSSEVRKMLANLILKLKANG